MEKKMKIKKLPTQTVKKASKPGNMRIKRAAKPDGGKATATKPGKITKRKNIKKATTNIIDARAMTREAMRKGMEEARMKREMKINKMLKGMK